ncbi:MAG TPA: hypothetical protein K8V11_13410 [Dietzia timorensis]|uniref:Uncharacterized protein n=1 Tax=Dietzia timorensis TaxID=499555 RepID=A0A921JZF3_9ACTN|nr:hypothetical protein [Dietzia timorensis]HJE91997.1 hypothetical protein [Dietzia timorensis]
MSNPAPKPGSNATELSSEEAGSSSQTAQQPAAPLTSFTDLLGLDDETGTVCTSDGYCS